MVFYGSFFSDAAPVEGRIFFELLGEEVMVPDCLQSQQTHCEPLPSWLRGVRLAFGVAPQRGLAAFTTLCGCTVPDRSLPALETVTDVDLSRYAGTRHEIARSPHRIQKDC